MKNQHIFFCLLLAIGSQQCNKSGCLESAGDIVVIDRSAAPFHQIDLFDNIDLVLTQDSIEWIKVETGKNLQPNITTVVDKGILTIKNKATCTWLRSPSEKVKVYVGVKNLDYLTYSASGNVSSTNTIVANKISFYTKVGAGNIDVTLDAKETHADIIYENSDFIFHGKSDVCYSYTNSRGSIDFKDFKVKHMIIGYAAARDATITVTETLESLLYHTGNLYYKGNPASISTQSYSSGKIIHLP